MSRLAISILALVLLVAYAALTLRIESDARSLFGLDEAPIAALDTPQGRSTTIAVIDPDRDRRSRIAQKIAEALRDDPQVARLDTGPVAPPRGLVDWLWLNRFRLEPPGAEALTRSAMVAEFAAARAAMATSTGYAMGDFFLRDPTGSFRRLISRIAAARTLGQHGGVWQSLDDRAALMFLTEADVPFDAGRERRLTAAVRKAFESAEPGAAELLMLGPRAITARIGDEIQSGATWTGVVSLTALLFWLAWVVRGTRRLAVCLVPMAIGFAVAAIFVEALFGSVHVIALGFGGALVGLALDYPLHLLSHRGLGEDAARTGRLVLVAAATTACSFLALVGSGLPGLMQIGVFIATGLTVAGLVSLWLAANEPAREVRAPAFERMVWRLPAKTALLVAVAVLGSSALARLPVLERDLTRMVAVPDEIRAGLAELREMTPAPDARYLVLLEGPDAQGVLEAGEAVAPVLDRAVEEKRLARYAMLASYLPSLSRQDRAHALLPAPSDFAIAMRAAAAEAGVNPDYAARIEEAYAAAYAAPTVGVDGLDRFPEVAPLAGLLRRDSGHADGIVLLTGTTNPAGLAASIDALGDGRVRFFDVNADLSAQLGHYRDAATLWFAIGAAGALAALWLALGRLRPVAELAAGVAASLAVTVLALVALGDALGIFQIVALTLVVGIGIDYGLFMASAAGPEQVRAAARSVGLCAMSTLIAFVIMALSPIDLLSEIGLTVAIGVSCILLISYARTAGTGVREDRDG